MTSETKNDYKFFYEYSIDNIDIDGSNNISNHQNLISIKNYVFSHSDLTKFTIKENVVSIGDYAFSGSKKLKQIEFLKPSSLKIIGQMAFSYCQIINIKIPSSVKIIGEGAFYYCPCLDEVSFDVNSQLTTIEKNTFYNSTIKTLYIPSKIEKLKQEWCCQTPNLNNIIVDAYNCNFTYYDNKFILGKVDLNCDNYEVLYFARRNIQNASIPFYIKLIASNAFENCQQLHNIIFSRYSQLSLIHNCAFKSSSINNIAIPSSVFKIGQYAFQYTDKLKKVIFNKDSELRIIDEGAFQYSSIEKIEIPSKVIRIKKDAFSNCIHLKSVFFYEKSNLKIIDKNAFFASSIKCFSVPSSTIMINENSFGNCSNLKIFEINEKSELCSFDISWFINSPSVTILIPTNLMILFNFLGN